jgi:hypothetical protein
VGKLILPPRVIIGSTAVPVAVSVNPLIEPVAPTDVTVPLLPVGGYSQYATRPLLVKTFPLAPRVVIPVPPFVIASVPPILLRLKLPSLTSIH